MQQIVDIYCRVSTDPQEDNTSLDEQESAGRSHCQENGLIVGLVHREVFSGFKYRERKELDRMRDRYRTGVIQGVVIRTLDRLSRSQIHNAVLMEEMEHYGVTLYCAKENIDDTQMGKFVRMVLAFVAEMEREKIIDRSTTGRINKAKAGFIVSGSKAPYGWQWLYGEDGNKTVVLDEAEAAVVQWIAEQYAAGVAAHSIRQQLDARGIPSPSGIAWNEHTIVRILSDPRITGKNAQIFAYQNRKTKNPLEPVDLPDGTYPAIIDEALFAAIQQRRGTNKAFAGRASKEPEEYLLRAGFIRCDYCKRTMATVKHRGKYIYRCTHNNRDTPDVPPHTNSILSKGLDAQVWQWLEQLADHIAIIQTAVELATSDDKAQQDTAAIQRSIATWQAKANNYLADLDDGSLIGDTRMAVRDALNTSLKMVAQLKAEQAQLQSGMIDKERERQAYQDILAWCKKVKGSREEMTYQQKRDFLQLVGARVLVRNIKPYYEHMVYRVEIALPAIQELIAPQRFNSDASSKEDLIVTEQLVEAGKLLDIELVDHIIIGDHRFVSIKERLHW